MTNLSKHDTSYVSMSKHDSCVSMSKRDSSCVDDAMIASFVAKSESGVVLGSWFGWLVT
jgi:hypothetical protein